MIALDLEIDNGEAIQFKLGDVTTTLRASRGDALVAAQMEVDTPDAVYDRLRIRAEARRDPLPAATDVERREPQEMTWQAVDETRNASGSSISPLDLSPEELDWMVHAEETKRFATDLRHRLEYPVFRLMQLVRWIGGLSVASLPDEHEALSWSLDGVTWHEAPPVDDTSQLFGEYELLIDDEWAGALQVLFQNEEFAEPVAWQIFHEAVELRSKSPRAAVVMALTAAEVGTKLLPSAVSASASEGWLALELPAPPMETLIRGYLPQLTFRRVRDRDDVIPKALRERLVRASSRRNKLVHTNALPPSDEDVGQVLADVYDYLYLLDWFSGHGWAIRRVSADGRDVYDLPT